jgi:hypothetical protein
MNQRLLALYGLKWNPFSPELPTEAIFVPPKLENFCWRIEHAQIREGGFAMIHGDPGTGKSIALRLLAERLSKLSDVTVGAVSHLRSRRQRGVRVVSAAATKPRKRRKPDHDAIERDYRLGTYTLRELAAQHGCSHQAIARMAKTKGWTQDLCKAVRAATNATLIQDAVATSIAKSGQAVANSVQAAAEVNKKIILGHRARLSEVTAIADAAKATVMALLPTLKDIREAATAMTAIECWSRVVRTVIDKEREAFCLTSDDNDGLRPLTRVVMVPAKETT